MKMAIIKIKKTDKSIVGKLINAKVKFGLGHPVKKILKFTDELAEELYKLVTRKFQRRKVNVKVSMKFGLLT